MGYLDTGRSFLVSTAGLWITFIATVLLTLSFLPVAGIWELTLLDGISAPEAVREVLAGMTTEQRTAHVWITATMDVAYPLAYGGLFAGVALRFFPRHGLKLALPALIVVPVDLFEGAVQILALTGMADWVVLKAFVTPLKMTLFYIGFVIAVAGWAKWFYERFGPSG